MSNSSDEIFYNCNCTYRYVHIKNLPLIKITMVRKKCPITGLFITLSQQNRLLHFSTLSSHYMLLSSSHKTVDSVNNFMNFLVFLKMFQKSLIFYLEISYRKSNWQFQTNFILFKLAKLTDVQTLREKRL